MLRAAGLVCLVSLALIVKGESVSLKEIQFQNAHFFTCSIFLIKFIWQACEAGTCVPYYKCATGDDIFDIVGLLDVRLNEETGRTVEHPCKGLFDTCCTVPSDEPKIPTVPIADGCGYRNPNGVGFTTLSFHNESQFGEFPWTAAILTEAQTEGTRRTYDEYQCSGSLIHPNVVLTAAHCVETRVSNFLKIRVGEWDTVTSDEIFPHQDRWVSKAVRHEKFMRGYYNDVALLFFNDPIVLSGHINTVCLPPQNHEFDGEGCFVTGWRRRNHYRSIEPTIILKRTELPIVPRDTCEQIVRDRTIARYKLHESFICAGGTNRADTCKGDGGAALVCPIPGTSERYYQAGAVSKNIGCHKNTPGKFESLLWSRV